MTEANVRTQIIDQLAFISFSNPSKSNALSVALLRALENAIRSLDKYEDLRAVVLQSEGKSFSAGHDFGELFDISEDDSKQLFNTCLSLMKRIRGAEVPVVAKVGGAAVGAGCQLALCCDFVVASREAFFQTGGGAQGWFCFSPMSTLVQQLSSKRALEMLFSGRKIYSETALEWGLINRVCAEEDLDHECMHFVKKVTRGDREMLALGKTNFYKMLELSEEDALELGSKLMVDTCRSESAQKRIQSSKIKKL